MEKLRGGELKKKNFENGLKNPRFSLLCVFICVLNPLGLYKKKTEFQYFSTNTSCSKIFLETLGTIKTIYIKNVPGEFLQANFTAVHF
jgi:hypothetical protein